MAPHRNANIKAITKRLVIVIQHLAAFMDEAQYRRMDHDVVSPAVLRMQREVEDCVEILIRNRNDNAGFAVTLFDGNFEVALSFVEAHREKLALLSGDE